MIQYMLFPAEKREKNPKNETSNAGRNRERKMPTKRKKGETHGKKPRTAFTFFSPSFSGFMTGSKGGPE